MSDRLRVQLASTLKQSQVIRTEIDSIVCHRLNPRTKAEEYLVAWNAKQWRVQPFSWHNTRQLSECLIELQRYTDSLNLKASTRREYPSIKLYSKKRKQPDDAKAPVQTVIDLISSDDDGSIITPSTKSSSPNSPLNVDNITEASRSYYGRLVRAHGKITMQGIPMHENVPASWVALPTTQMCTDAKSVKPEKALQAIRFEFLRKLREIPGPRVTLYSSYGWHSPPLWFDFIETSKLGAGVVDNSQETIIGCGENGCRPHMGQHIGCEYTQKCECLEFAAVDEARLSPHDLAHWKQTQDGTGLPKRSPYFNHNLRNGGCLVPFYLESRHVVYECNPRCECGPECRTRVVQQGRKVGLEIFRTLNRGWGLRAREALLQGQFIDTYRGEIITDADADEREAKKTGAAKVSYLSSLDKFNQDLAVDERDGLVVDGEFMGSVTRFVNHSCEPNCRQYAVSFNKYDTRKYELAFFAIRNIEKGEELTFDYLDKDDTDDDAASNDSVIRYRGQPNSYKDVDDAMKCLCGSQKCRGLLWA